VKDVVFSIYSHTWYIIYIYIVVICVVCGKVKESKPVKLVVCQGSVCRRTACATAA
jgi:hypothetical protein